MNTDDFYRPVTTKSGQHGNLLHVFDQYAAVVFDAPGGVRVLPLADLVTDEVALVDGWRTRMRTDPFDTPH